MIEEKYPTRAELKKIKTWDILDPVGLINFLQSIWWAPDWGFKLTGKKILKLELHTGGWSGNEDIIGTLSKTMFWFLYWQLSRRGGHFYFEIKKRK